MPTGHNGRESRRLMIKDEDAASSYSKSESPVAASLKRLKESDQQGAVPEDQIKTAASG